MGICVPDAANCFSKKQLSHLSGNEEFGCSRFASLRLKIGEVG